MVFPNLFNIFKGLFVQHIPQIHLMSQQNNVNPKIATIPQQAAVSNGLGKNGLFRRAVPVSFNTMPAQLKDDDKEKLVQKKQLGIIQRKTGAEEDSLQMKQLLQFKEVGEEELVQKKPYQLKQDTLQNKTAHEKEEPLQKKPFQLAERNAQARSNINAGNSSLPGNLKAGVEALSGIAMDDVKVHYNSNKPAQLQALAYAQGTDIHIGPGQEKHLPHEAWHVLQQKQGRVKPTMQMKGGVPVNDDKELEHEADVMGEEATRPLQPNIQADTATMQRKLARGFAKPPLIFQRRISEDERNKILSPGGKKLDDSVIAAHTKILGKGALAKNLEGVAGVQETAMYKTYGKEESIQVETDIWDGMDVRENEKVSFDNYYSEHVWIMGVNYKDANLVTFNASQVIEHQRKEAGVPSGPHYVVRKNIVNNRTIDFAAQVRKNQAVSVEITGTHFTDFFTDTDNGKHTVRILQDNGLEAVYAQVLGTQESPTIIIEAQPATGANEAWNDVLNAKKKAPGDKKPERKEARADNLDERKQAWPGRSSEVVQDLSGMIEVPVNRRAKKKCYITTACVERMGLPDDCEELTYLRGFRDGFLMEKPNGPAMIELYYQHSPEIVNAIRRRDDEDDILKKLYGVICNCVKAIKQGDNDYAYNTYCNMVMQLKEEFIPEVQLPVI